MVDKILLYSYQNPERANKIESAFELKMMLLKGTDSASRREHTITHAQWLESLGTNFEKQEDDRLSFYWYEQALLLYRKEKAHSDISRLMLLLEPIKLRNMEKMMSFSNEIDVSREYEIVKTLMSRRPTISEKIICLCALTHFDKKQEIEADVIRNSNKYVFTKLSTANLLDKSGRSIIKIPPLSLKNPREDKDILELHMHREAAERQHYYGKMMINMAWYIIKEEHPSVVAEDLDFLVNENSMIPNDRKQLFKLGFVYGLNGDLYTSLHLLVPQMENFFRELATLCGGVVYSVDEDGTEQTKTLKSVFDIPELVECYEEDILSIFEGLLNQKAGANLRNKVAHGLLDSDEGNSTISLYFFSAVLKLLSWYSPDSVALYKGIRDEIDNLVASFEPSGEIG